MSADERVDVVDDRDFVVAQATRREVRQQNLRHRCVYVLVFNDLGELLIHRRTETKDVYPGFWDVACGGVLAAGESYDDAAARELEEECGISGVEMESLFPVQFDDSSTRVCGRVYRCVANGPLRLQEEEVAVVEWIAPLRVAELARDRKFCPDGWLVWQRYLSTKVSPG